MNNSYPVLRTLTVIVALCGMTAGNALADCPSPYRPSVESVDGVTRLNAYAEGPHCIIGPTPYCSNCVSGYQHTCDAYGRWQVDKAYPCKKASNKSRPSNESGSDKSGSYPGSGKAGGSNSTVIRPVRYRACHYYMNGYKVPRMSLRDAEAGVQSGHLTRGECFQKECRYFNASGQEIDLSHLPVNKLLDGMKQRNVDRVECTPDD
ncbi:exported hypothetical protein [Candidatus Competibacter denitrificans Run_A_D11]|uniref:Uncharacterized protein n=1 Tax=Candidatus Competibacter denitrificans Run_A_D11 TaxID=1400863 RepID=W6M9F4_9GAMM|nr:exported hypothetical protein [Candidatus Competibacter denitrificans Run_A_D11]